MVSNFNSARPLCPLSEAHPLRCRQVPLASSLSWKSIWQGGSLCPLLALWDYWGGLPTAHEPSEPVAKFEQFPLGLDVARGWTMGWSPLSWFRRVRAVPPASLTRHSRLSPTTSRCSPSSRRPSRRARTICSRSGSASDAPTPSSSRTGSAPGSCTSCCGTSASSPGAMASSGSCVPRRSLADL